MQPAWLTALRKTIQFRCIVRAVVDAVLSWDACCRVRNLYWQAMVMLRVDGRIT